MTLALAIPSRCDALTLHTVDGASGRGISWGWTLHRSAEVCLTGSLPPPSVHARFQVHNPAD
eukprot:1546849-Rhodomonas_salina.2